MLIQTTSKAALDARLAMDRQAMSGVRERPVHGGRLERWLGADQVERISASMKDWYGPPVPVSLMPGGGKVFAVRGGDFVGRMPGGRFMGLAEATVDEIKRRVRRWARHQRTQLNAGIASISELISEGTTGKDREFQFLKNGPTGVIAVTSSLWRLGAMPIGGAAPAAAAGGTAYTDASVGAFPFTNPTGGDTQHIVSANPLASVAGNTLLLYDLIFGVAKTMNSSGTEAVTGVPTRYQSSTPGNADYAGGNFIAVHVGGTALAATAHNWTVCTYRNQAGTDAQTMPSLTGNSGAIVDRLDHPVGQWFAPLASGDTGAMDLAQMQCSALVATGVIWFMIGHPIAFMPCPIANIVCPSNYVTEIFNMARVFDDACLAFLEVCKPSATATNYTGSFKTVAS